MVRFRHALTVRHNRENIVERRRRVDSRRDEVVGIFVP